MWSFICRLGMAFFMLIYKLKKNEVKFELCE